MRIVNKTRDTIISEDSDIAYSLLSRALGLMLSRPRDLVLVSPRDDVKSSTIHMLFMLFSIDVIWADSKRKIVDLRKDLKPFNPIKPESWRIYKPSKPSKYVIELVSGKIADTEIGDEIVFLDSDTPKPAHQPL